MLDPLPRPPVEQLCGFGHSGGTRPEGDFRRSLPPGAASHVLRVYPGDSGYPSGARLLRGSSSRGVDDLLARVPSARRRAVSAKGTGRVCGVLRADPFPADSLRILAARVATRGLILTGSGEPGERAGLE